VKKIKWRRLNTIDMQLNSKNQIRNFRY